MVNYVQKTKQKGKESALSVVITKLFKAEKSNDRLKIGLGISCVPELIGSEENNFNFNLEYLKRKKSSKAIKLIHRINDFERNINLTEQFFKVEKKVPSKFEFRDKLIQLLAQDGLISYNNSNSTIIEENIYFDSFIDSFIKENICTNQRLRNYKADSTIAKYKVIHKHLVKYQLWKKLRLKMIDITNNDLIKIVDSVNTLNLDKKTPVYLENDLKKFATSIDLNYLLKINHRNTRNEKGMSEVTARNILSNLKTFVKHAQKKNLMLGVNLNDDTLNYSVNHNAKSNLYYSNELLEHIYDYDPLNVKTQIAKDYILIASLSGMRYQSVCELNEYSIKELKNEEGESFYAMANIARKTRNELLSPIFKPVKEIYLRNECFPTFPDLVSLNKYIKELFTEMNINDEINYVEYIYNYQVIESKRKISDIASSHDNRGSFITNLNLMYVDPHIVKAMTHEKIHDRSSHQIYLKRKMDDLAIQFYNHTKNLNSRVYTY